MYSIVVPFDEVEPMVVVDVVKTGKGKLTFDVMVKMEKFEGHMLVVGCEGYHEGRVFKHPNFHIFNHYF